MDNRLKAVINHRGEVVFAGTHRECNRWLLDTYPGPLGKRIKSYEVNSILPGPFKIQLVKEEVSNG